MHDVDEKEVQMHHETYTETDVHIKPRIETLTETFNLMDVDGTGMIERSDLEEAVNHDRGGAFFSKMGTPPNAISKKEYLKFFYVIRKTKGEAELDKILNMLQKEIPAWASRHHRREDMERTSATKLASRSPHFRAQREVRLYPTFELAWLLRG